MTARPTSEAVHGPNADNARPLDQPVRPRLWSVLIGLPILFVTGELLFIAANVSDRFNREPLTVVLATMGASLSLAVYVAFVHIGERRRCVELRGGRRALVDIAEGVGLGLAVTTSVVAAWRLLGVAEVGGRYQWELFSATLAALLLITLRAVFEEALFRGLILRYCELLAGTWPALLVSSALFALWHVARPAESPAWLTYHFLMGVALGAAYLVTRRLWMPIAMHAAHNVAVGLVWGDERVLPLFRWNVHGGWSLFAGNGFRAFAIGVTAILAIALILVAWRKGRFVGREEAWQAQTRALRQAEAPSDPAVGVAAAYAGANGTESILDTTDTSDAAASPSSSTAVAAMLKGPVVTDYDIQAEKYSMVRIPDPRIERRIHAAIGDAPSVVNVGAGTGAYEPTDRKVLAVEPSAAMIAARPPQSAPAIQAAAEALPLADDSYDAAMAILTMHHWTDAAGGLRELRRVARRRVVLFTWDPEFDDALWLTRRYFPGIRTQDIVCFPTFTLIESILGPLTVEPVPIPHDCSDGFLGSCWRRPRAYFSPTVRNGMSGFSRLSAEETADGLKLLSADLRSGEWQRLYGHLLALDEMDLGYRLIVAG